MDQQKYSNNSSFRLMFPTLLPPSSSTMSPYPNNYTESLPHKFTKMSETSRNCVIALCIIFVISAVGNVTVFITVYRQLSKLKWRITMLILHLSIADMFVTFFTIPMDIFWKFFIAWHGGNMLCKVCSVFRAFGLYLSSNIIICISLDRWMAILFPLRFGGFTTRRVRIMLTISWIFAALLSLPQVRAIIYIVIAGPLACSQTHFYE